MLTIKLQERVEDFVFISFMASYNLRNKLAKLEDALAPLVVTLCHNLKRWLTHWLTDSLTGWLLEMLSHLKIWFQPDRNCPYPRWLWAAVNWSQPAAHSRMKLGEIPAIASCCAAGAKLWQNTTTEWNKTIFLLFWKQGGDLNKLGWNWVLTKTSSLMATFQGE